MSGAVVGLLAYAGFSLFPSVTLAQCIYYINAYPLVYMRMFITVITSPDVRLFDVVSVPLEDIGCEETECS
jgi:hypothetical protein